MLFATPLLAALVFLAGNEEETFEAMKCAYVLIIMAVFWVTEALPVAVTSLIPVAAFPLLGIMSTVRTCITLKSSVEAFASCKFAFSFQCWRASGVANQKMPYSVAVRRSSERTQIIPHAQSICLSQKSSIFATLNLYSAFLVYIGFSQRTTRQPLTALKAFCIAVRSSLSVQRLRIL